MKKVIKREKVIKSLEEFRKIYLPKQERRIIIETPEEARDFGIILADESLKKIKIKSVK